MEAHLSRVGRRRGIVQNLAISAINRLIRWSGYKTVKHTAPSILERESRTANRVLAPPTREAPLLRSPVGHHGTPFKAKAMGHGLALEKRGRNPSSPSSHETAHRRTQPAPETRITNQRWGACHPPKVTTRLVPPSYCLSSDPCSTPLFDLAQRPT